MSHGKVGVVWGSRAFVRFGRTKVEMVLRDVLPSGCLRFSGLGLVGKPRNGKVNLLRLFEKSIFFIGKSANCSLRTR
jgi:hypothetical protein